MWLICVDSKEKETSAFEDSKELQSSLFKQKSSEQIFLNSLMIKSV